MLTRDETVLEVLSHARRMISSYAFAYGLDKEDITQELACEMLEAWDKATCAKSAKAYLYGVARKCLADIVRRHEKPLSLDMPLSKNTNITLGETLSVSDKPSEEEKTRTDATIQAVHRVLHKCRPEAQMYAIRVHCLTAYEHTFLEIKRDRDAGNCNWLRMLRSAFRKDTEIRSLIGC